MTKRPAALAALCGLGLCCLSAAGADERGVSIFSDNFDAEGTFAENWVSKRALPRDGKVRVPAFTTLAMRGTVPLEFVAEADVTVCPSWSTLGPEVFDKGWGGFYCDGYKFCVKPSGKAFMTWKVPGQPSANGRYPVIEGFSPGAPVRLRVMRKRTGQDCLQYAFWVNGSFVAHFVAPLPRPKRSADGREGYEGVTINTYRLDLELDNFDLRGVRHDDDSPNTILNSGFEYVEDGMPTHYGWRGSFNFAGCPIDRFASDYLHRYGVDAAEKHSGRQSLRVLVNQASESLLVSPWRPGTVFGSAGVFSVWMKANVDSLRVRLTLDPKRIGKVLDGSRIVEVGREWRRFEVTRSELGKRGAQSPLGISVLDPSQQNAVLWIDDLQLEMVPLPAGGFRPEVAYATPYKPSELDQDRFGPRPEPPPSATPEAPELSAGNGPAADGGDAAPDFVLGRLDFYMDEPFAQWRVCGADGKVTIVQKPLAEIPLGTNLVEFSAHGKTYSDTVVRLPYRKGATQVNRWTRSVVHDGQPELLTGICIGCTGHLGYKPPANPFPGMFALLRRDGFRHFLFMASSRSGRMASARACLDESRRQGVLCAFWSDYDVWNYDDKLNYAGLKPIDDVRMEEMIALTHRYDHLLTHIVIDEPELHHSSAWTRGWLEKLKPHYPYAPVQMNNTSMGIPNGFADLQTDILMLDSYLTNTEGRTVDSVVRQVDVMCAVPGGKPCWFFIVGDNMSLHYKNPSYAEQIAQSWGCICAGCTGIAWYSGFPATAGSYRAMVDVNREAQALKAVILSEELCGSATADLPKSRLRHLTRTLNGDWYVLSCNIDARPQTATFALPPEAPRNGVIEVLFENRTLPLRDGVFRDGYSAHSRHIYKVR
ncbi:MAG: hypothetical protein ACI4RD_06770 [Kiritimatiellia bacterium]